MKNPKILYASWLSGFRCRIESGVDFSVNGCLDDCVLG